VGAHDTHRTINHLARIAYQERGPLAEPQSALSRYRSAEAVLWVLQHLTCKSILSDLLCEPRRYDLIMKLDDAARLLFGSAPATLVTVNRDGSPQVSVVWIVAQSAADGDDELVTAHLHEHQKVRNVRRDPRVAVTIVSTDRSGPQTPYLSIKGTARVEEGGAPELLSEIATAIFGPGTGFPPPDAPPGYLTRITIEKVGGVGPWAT
jgi:PPOX class probable F420-dependent enzyme